jgi:protein-L-isoaspartate(D-aspartate) O-methyltransferase
VGRIEEARRRYAEELRSAGSLRSEPLVRAFATVPRELYLGPGPWKILEPRDVGAGYRATEDGDPVWLYRNVLVAIDPTRRLNNGEPLALARWFDRLEPRPGDRVLHVGCGVGYYTAVLAEAVGPSGDVLALEIDRELAARARANLGHYANVDVVCADGSAHDPGARNVIFVNAGATCPAPVWVDRLADGGRLLVPLTVAFDESGVGAGHMLEVARTGERYAATFVGPVGIFPCAGARDDETNGALRRAYTNGSPESVKSLRRDRHDADVTCWLHFERLCLSREGRC